jgi:hypothetical protein
MTSRETSPGEYQAPALRVLGTVAELTQGCTGKRMGGSDTFIFRGTTLVCTSA